MKNAVRSRHEPFGIFRLYIVLANAAQFVAVDSAVALEPGGSEPDDFVVI